MKPEELQILKNYFPENAVPMVAEAFNQSRFQLKFKRPRTSKLGDFREPRGPRGICVITLNMDMNPYQMLVTFVHELAHYDVYVHYPKKKLEPHGEEWKQAFTRLLLPYLRPDIFPDDVIQALREHLRHIKASSGADTDLAKVLKSHNANSSGEKPRLVEDLPEGALFKLSNGMTYRKGPKLRTRYLCECLDNGRKYSVSGVAEVI